MADSIIMNFDDSLSMIAKVNSILCSVNLPPQWIVVLSDHSDYGECVSLFAYDTATGSYIFESSGTYWGEIDALHYNHEAIDCDQYRDLECYYNNLMNGHYD